ncbi:replicative DNA helicase loader DnaB [Pelagirhabdus alkalitolerans]|uniref:Replicative DNA helicase loader DnaB n=1 Tax=Pelagirhabdus alkalitolerans TaxID=1612202 RepID=A0A1G6HKY7_9BACI|nr:DnaD domain protein [Pelagirhabdus alkalitolerans]SDB94778.1 replicative DNA helicase loader DnaB [Pelagirhabdus alkalitolerans]
MHQSIGKILPSDGFLVQESPPLTYEHYQALYQLYQPIIGAKSVAVYMTLNTQVLHTKTRTHHHLMQTMNLSLDEWYDARIKCEAIGLIQTYKEKNADVDLYYYRLLKPSTAFEFLQDDLLSQMLYHHVGQPKYQELLERIEQTKNLSLDQKDDITKPFTDIFSVVDPISVPKPSADSNESTSSIDIDVSIDWDWLKKVLEDRMLPSDIIFSQENNTLIKQMTALYRLDTNQLEKALQWAIDENHSLNRTEFKTACLDLTTMSEESPKEVNKREKIKDRSSSKEKTKQERFIDQMETITPKELLEDLSNGSQASTQDLKMIASIMEQQGLTPGVMNVLIHYVMLKTDMKLTKSYLEKIASHWSRKNVKTVHQAMTLAKSEHKKYQQWTHQPKKSYYNSKAKKEVVPEWFKNQKTNSAKQSKQTDDSSQDVTDLLKSFEEQKTQK